MTVIQRFGSAINLNVHFHVLALDGVYAPVAEVGGPSIRFHALPPPETDEVGKLLRVVAHRILRVLARSGRLREEEDGYAIVSREEDASGGVESALASCQAASVRSRIALGPRAGRRVTRLGDLVDEDWASEDGPGQPSRPRCQEYAGFSLHADVR